jgi:hypothetical protein
MRRTLSILAAVAAIPLMAMSGSTKVYVDAATEVPMPVCSLETCDAKPGHCEFDEGYHTPVPVEGLALSIARESSATTTVNAE